MDEGLRVRLRISGAFADELGAPGFVAGRWHRSEPARHDPGVWTMPWFELSDRAEAFVRALGGILEPFEWTAWLPTPEAQALYHDREVLAAATPEQLSKLATAIIRSDRFTEGALGEAFDVGVMAAIARRAGTWSAGSAR
ncbi:MAG: DUF6508 domain-containing protein [Chloroflexota bacterium]